MLNGVLAIIYTWAHGCYGDQGLNEGILTATFTIDAY